MAQKKTRGTRSIVQRLRGRIKVLNTRLKRKKSKFKSMAFGRNRRFNFRNPFRRNRSYGYRPARKSYRGGFNRRLPVVGWRVPSIVIWLAIAGGAIFFGKDYIKPLVDKLKDKV
ncbi:MAG TPA: hypothetical protein VHA56_03170 [Mucilaginibacter sp.]|nr:hypothetical protein [Mucilaginibacter sp.]